jgi:hypothetical protein
LKRIIREIAMDDEKPPFLGTWKRIYGSVIAYTCALILLLYWITVALNR